MPANKSFITPAPRGLNASALPAALSPERSPLIINMRADRAGRLRASLRLTDVAELIATADGLSYYYGATAEQDKLLAIANGSLYAGSPVDITAIPPKWDMEAVGGGFAIGKRVKSVHYNQETFFVQEDGIHPLRYDGTGLYQLGISPPINPPTVLPSTPTSGTTNKAGTIRYYVSYFDSRLRESDLGPYTEINYASFPGTCGMITIDYGTDPQVIGAYIYATIAGVITVRYRIATMLKSEDDLQWEDNSPDSIVRTNITAESVGTFSIPNPASTIEIHGRHIVLNDTTQPDVLQINNLDEPTHWATITSDASDGSRMRIGTHQGAGVNALLAVGTLLFISTRQGISNLWGDSTFGNNQFNIRALQNSIGILAPYSWVMCTNRAIGLHMDGKIYAMGGEDAFLFHELSQDIEELLRFHTIRELERAVAVWSNNIYAIYIGQRGYCYDFTAGGWFLLEGLHTDSILIPLTSSIGGVGGTNGNGGGGIGGGIAGFIDANHDEFILPTDGGDGGRVFNPGLINPVEGGFINPEGGHGGLGIHPVDPTDPNT